MEEIKKTFNLTKIADNIYWADVSDRNFDAYGLRFERRDGNNYNTIWNNVTVQYGSGNCMKISKDKWDTGSMTTYTPGNIFKLRGFDNWTGIEMTTTDGNIFTATKSLSANTTYKKTNNSSSNGFLVATSDWGVKYGTGTFTSNSTTQALTRTGEDCSLTTTYAGDYKFSFNWNSNTLIVYYPSQVTFNANGHGTAPAAQVVTYNQIATAPAAPEATGYVFGGWYSDVACTGTAFDFTNTPITEDIILYAKWTAETESCTYSGFITNGTGNTANNNRYKICAPIGTLVNLQTGTGDENQPASGVEFIFLNSFSKQITACSLGEGNYTIWPGSMAIGLYLSAFNAAETTFTITDEDGDHTFRVSNERPDVTYSVTASAAAGCTISDLSGYTALRGGETVNFTVTTASGKKVTSVTMNGTALTATGVTEKGV